METEAKKRGWCFGTISLDLAILNFQNPELCLRIHGIIKMLDIECSFHRNILLIPIRLARRRTEFEQHSMLMSGNVIVYDHN